MSAEEEIPFSVNWSRTDWGPGAFASLAPRCERCAHPIAGSCVRVGLKMFHAHCAPGHSPALFGASSPKL